MVGLQVFQVSWEIANNLVDEGLSIAVIDSDEHLLGQLGKLEISLTCHVLYTRGAFMHEFVQFVHDMYGNRAIPGSSASGPLGALHKLHRGHIAFWVQ